MQRVVSGIKSAFKKENLFTFIVMGIALIVLVWPLLEAAVGAIIGWLPTQDTCSFGLSNGACSYDPVTGPINFSLGEAVAGVGIFLAVTQLAEPVRKLAIRINDRLRLTSLVLLTVGFVSILISSFIPHLTGHYKILSTPLTWEIIGYLCFITAPIIYYYATTKRTHLFKPNLKSAERFYDELLGALGTGKPEYAEAALNIFMANAVEIFRAAKLLEPHLGHFDDDNREVPDNLEYARYANDLIVILLSEQRVANLLATQRIDYLFHLLELIRENYLTEGAVLTATEKIFEQLFEDPNSHLYNQLERSGLTLYAPLYDFLFGDEHLFFVGQVNALKSWGHYGVGDDVKLNEKYVKVYLEVLEVAIKRYGFKNNHSAVRALGYALGNLRKYAEGICRLEDPYEKGKVSTNSSIMMDIEHFFGHTFPMLLRLALLLITSCRQPLINMGLLVVLREFMQ
jgi:hypothetical protein